MIIYIIKSFKRKFIIYKMEYVDEKYYNKMLAEDFMKIGPNIIDFGTSNSKPDFYNIIPNNIDYSDMPELEPEIFSPEEVILPEKVQKRLMRPLKEEIRINARTIYDELPILMQDDVKRAEVAVLLAKTAYDRDYKRNLAREKKGRSDSSEEGEVKTKLTKYELLDNKDAIYEHYQICRKYAVTAKHFGISDFLVKKVVAQYNI